LSAATTFTLTCDGPGGAAAQTVEVSVTQQAEGGDGGGGGAIDYLALALLSLCVAVNICRLRRIPGHRCLTGRALVDGTNSAHSTVDRLGSRISPRD
jgi:hypothetical protein